MKILLVDDDIFLRDMYATKFLEKGDEVVTAENGDDALRIARTEVFDAIIMDMVMPGMTGIELLGALMQLEGMAKTKCIILSNQGEETDIASAEKSGAAGYIIKADSIPSEVVEKVHQLVS